MEPGGLYSINLWVVAAVALTALVASAEAGRRVGLRAHGAGAESDRQRIAMFEGALLGLLSLMIGFTFSLALNRFESRKSIVLAEANAIGTVALRAKLLPAPLADSARHLAKAYAQQRMALGVAPYASAARDSSIAASVHLQELLWTQAAAASALDPRSVAAGQFVAGLNDLIDEHEIRVTADRNHVPQAVLILLYAIAIVAMGFAGFTGGVAGAHRREPALIMAVVVVAVITLIMDLDRPRRGLVTVSQQPMADLIAGL
jgi:hypothetical protein